MRLRLPESACQFLDGSSLFGVSFLPLRPRGAAGRRRDGSAAGAAPDRAGGLRGRDRLRAAAGAADHHAALTLAPYCRSFARQLLPIHACTSQAPPSFVTRAAFAPYSFTMPT